MAYQPSETRYQTMRYNRCGRSGLLLPAISLGLWHNFGGVDTLENARALIQRAFDLGITHLDLANNYGPPPGSAEETLGLVLNKDLRAYRDELVISTKAGYTMWPGPYGDWGSRKYLVSSLDQSLKRLGLEYVDIFYSHRPDPNTPLEETMGALDYIVRSGRALYVGISNYPADKTRDAAKILKNLGTPCLIHQPAYNMFNRWIENGLTHVLEEEGIGCIPFSPLARGLLTDRYLEGIPQDSRYNKTGAFKPDIAPEKIEKVTKIAQIARQRGQNTAQLALAWILRLPQVTSALIGASKVEQIDEAVGALNHLDFSQEELNEIENILGS